MDRSDMPNKEEFQEFLSTPEGKAAVKAFVGGKMLDSTIQMAGGRFLVKGQKIKVGSIDYFVVDGIEHREGHYLIAPDLSEHHDTAWETPTAPVMVLYHRPTVEWMKELRDNPAQVLGELMGQAADAAVEAMKTDE